MDKSKIKKKIELLKRKLARHKRKQSPAMSESARSSSDRSESPPPKRRRRVVSSDSSEHEPDTDKENNVASTRSEKSEMIPGDLLSLLGEDPALEKEVGEDIHPHVAIRWAHLLQSGVKKDQRSDLIKKYLPPANCALLEAPKLNEEIKAAVQDASLKRDEKIVLKQSQLGAGIACLGRALDVAFRVGDKDLRDQLIMHLGDAGKILCDLHFLQSMTRRSLLVQGLNKDTKDAVKNLKRDKFLFGSGLAETLRAIKACSKSALDLKIKAPKIGLRFSNENFASTSGHRSSASGIPSLNWRGPSRRTAFPAMTAGGVRERRQPGTAGPRRPPASRSQRPPPPPPAKRY